MPKHTKKGTSRGPKGTAAQRAIKTGGRGKATSASRAVKKSK